MSILPMSMREKIAEIIGIEVLSTRNRDGMGCWNATDAIIAALPEMIPDLVWYKDSFNNLSSGKYLLIGTIGGYRSYYGNETLEGLYHKKEEAKAAANVHHRASIMAAFTGEPT
jgi:hypothetical protein